MTPDQIRYLRDQINAVRRGLEAKLDLLDIDLQNLQAQCQHAKKRADETGWWYCPDCDDEGQDNNADL